MSSLRESFERASYPALVRLSRLPRAVPFLAILALVVAGLLLPAGGWVLLLLVVAVLSWVLALAWPKLSPVERLMRVAVIALMVAVFLTQAFPR